MEQTSRHIFMEQSILQLGAKDLRQNSTHDTAEQTSDVVDSFAPWAKTHLEKLGSLFSPNTSRCSDALSSEARAEDSSPKSPGECEGRLWQIPSTVQERAGTFIHNAAVSPCQALVHSVRQSSFLHSVSQSQPVSVTIAAVPSFVDVGDLLVSTWAAVRGECASGDWIGLYRANEDSARHYKQFADCRDVSGGSWTLNAPREPGVYVFRFITARSVTGRAGACPLIHGRTFTVLAESNQVTVGTVAARSEEHTTISHRGAYNNITVAARSEEHTTISQSYYDSPDVALRGGEGNSLRSTRSLSGLSDEGGEGDAGPFDESDESDAGPLGSQSQPILSPQISGPQSLPSPNNISSSLKKMPPHVLHTLAHFSLDAKSSSMQSLNSDARDVELSRAASDVPSHRTLRTGLRGTFAGVTNKLMGYSSSTGVTAESLPVLPKDVAHHAKTLGEASASKQRRETAIEFLFRESLYANGRTALKSTPNLDGILVQEALDTQSEALRIKLLQILVVLLSKVSEGGAVHCDEGAPSLLPHLTLVDISAPVSEPARDKKVEIANQRETRPGEHGTAHEAVYDARAQEGEYEYRLAESVSRRSDFWALIEAVNASKSPQQTSAAARLLCTMLQASVDSVSGHLPALLPILWRTAIEDAVLREKDKEDTRERLLAQCMVCYTFAELATRQETRQAMLSSSAGLDSLRVLLVMLPQWYVAFRMKPLEQATRAIFLLAGEQPGLVAEAGGTAVMLLLVRSMGGVNWTCAPMGGVNIGNVLEWVVSTLDRLVNWQQLRSQRSREGSPRCSSASSREFAAEVLKDVPALVAHMSTAPELSVPVAHILLNVAKLDGSTKVYCKVMSMVSPWIEPLSHKALHSPSQLVCSKYNVLGDVLAEKERERENEATHAQTKKLQADAGRGGVEALFSLLSHVNLLDRTSAYSSYYSDCLAFAAECVLSMCVGVEKAALESEKGRVVLQDLQQQGVSKILAQSAQRQCGDRYFEIPTWLEDSEDEDRPDVAVFDAGLVNIQEALAEDSTEGLSKLVLASHYFMANGGRDVICSLLLSNDLRAQTLILRALAKLTKFEGWCCWILQEPNVESSLVKLLRSIHTLMPSAEAHNKGLETQWHDMLQAASACLANFCACQSCRDKIVEWKPLGILSSLHSSFTADSLICRQVARGLQYLCMDGATNRVSSLAEWLRRSSAADTVGFETDEPQPQAAASKLWEEGFRGEWEAVGVAMLFELCKSKDACVLAWTAKGFKNLLKFVSCHPLWSKTVLTELNQDRRPAPLLSLLNHPSPLVTADAMEGLAYLSGLNSTVSETRAGNAGPGQKMSAERSGGQQMSAVQQTRRILYLNGCMYLVISLGLRGLPCVTMCAAAVAANLSKDIETLENMMEYDGKASCFAFLRFLVTQVGKDHACNHTHANVQQHTKSGGDDTGKERRVMSEGEKPEAAWGQLAGWLTAPGCGAYAWENDVRLMKHAKLLATETIKRICSHDQVHPAFLRFGGVPLLITMAHQMAEGEEESCKVLVAQSIEALAKGERVRWERGSPLFASEQVKELKGAVKVFFSVQSEATQKAAETALVLFSGMDKKPPPPGPERRQSPPRHTD